MKQKVLATSVALAMVLLFTGCIPSPRIEGKIVREVEADNETKEDLIEVNTELMKLPTVVSPPFAGGSKRGSESNRHYPFGPFSPLSKSRFTEIPN